MCRCCSATQSNCRSSEQHSSKLFRCPSASARHDASNDNAFCRRRAICRRLIEILRSQLHTLDTMGGRCSVVLALSLGGAHHSGVSDDRDTNDRLPGDNYKRSPVWSATWTRPPAIKDFRSCDWPAPLKCAQSTVPIEHHYDLPTDSNNDI